jgi:RHS repeat-associated protein
MVGRFEPDTAAEWVYDLGPHAIGKLVYQHFITGPNWARGFTYDTLGRPVIVSSAVEGSTYTFTAAYDGNSRLSTVTYPSSASLTYTYTSLGYAQQVTGPGGQVYWTANARDAELHLTQQTAGNGVVTNQGFDPHTGRLTTILAGTGTSYIVENFSYTYDTLGNVLTRGDANENNLTETFTYDVLNRLTSAQVSQSIPPLLKTFAYDFIGNLLSKSDVGAYTYPASSANSVRPHAVTSISGATINTTFAYDPNGNQTAGLGRTISYTSFNKPSAITNGSSTLNFSHDIDHQRFKQQIAPEGTTTFYFDAFGVHAELISNGTPQWNEYLTVGGTLIGMRVLRSGSGITTRYFHTDNLGSIAVITDESGGVSERLSYDAWGKRRNLDGSDNPSGHITSQTTRGFTGQEELDDVGLVHLNGRVYDPLIGRMMSADPFVPDPLNAQAWNRYSYVINNPLAFTDPNGYCFLGMCSWGKAISTFGHRTFGKVRAGILGNLFEMAAVAICMANPVCAPAAWVVAFTSTTLVAGITSGDLGYALQSGFIAGATAIAFNVVGGLTNVVAGESFFAPHIPLQFGTPAYAFNIAGHALVGCASAAASGGKCGGGALSAGVSAAAGAFNTSNFALNVASHAVVGGLATRPSSASVIGRNWRTFITAKSFSGAVAAAQGSSAMSIESAARAARDSSAAEQDRVLGLVRYRISNWQGSVSAHDRHP